jgi:hypothetical protein
MFVFVTPNSIKSVWLYFEAGFAYSNGIEVIPVGIGINVGQLKPNLLQGFDMTTAESMNNFLSFSNTCRLRLCKKRRTNIFYSGYNQGHKT